MLGKTFDHIAPRLAGGGFVVNRPNPAKELKWMLF
jgi:hypothetical protein